MTLRFPKPDTLRDPEYLRAVHDMPCAVTGYEGETDPAHIRYGFYGAGQKPGDDLVIPLRHSLHQESHQNTQSEAEFWLTIFNEYPHFAMECLKAFARETYRKWKE